MDGTETITPPDMKEYFEFLDDLRESGTTNMMGATPYLQSKFGIPDRREAQKILVKWMDTFEAREKAGEVKEDGGLKVTETHKIDFRYEDED